MTEISKAAITLTEAPKCVHIYQKGMWTAEETL